MLHRFTRFSQLRDIISVEYGSPVRRYVAFLPMHGSSRSYLRSHQLHLLLDAHYKGPVHILQETMELMSPPNAVPYKCRIQVLLKTNSDTEEELNLFVQLLTDNPDDLTKKANAYMRVDEMIKMKKEIQIYTVVIAAIEKFQKQMKIKQEFRYQNVFANFIGARLSLESTTADLPDQFSAILLDTPGFRYYKTESNGTGFTGFDFLNAKTILRDMARFHACPIAMKIKNEKKFMKKVMSFLSLEVKDFEKLPPFKSLCHKLLTDGLKHKPEVLHQIPFLRESLQLSRLSEWIQEDHEDKTWYTLCHSRYCIPNIITSYPSRVLPRRSKLLELSKLRFNNCCLDLAFFMFTSLQADILEINFRMLLEEYYTVFATTLGEHKVPLENYTYGKFISEFLDIGKRSIGDILISIKASSCEGTDAAGEPLLGGDYRRRVKVAVRLAAGLM